MGNPTATCKTSMGTFEVELFLDRTPVTASNFIDLAKSGFYNGLHFHRVIPGFMNQFGCPNSRDVMGDGQGRGGPDPNTQYKNYVTGDTVQRSDRGKIPDEFIDQTSNKPGTFSMANSGQPNSGGSQFFINVADNARLDHFSPGASRHPVFGAVTSGMDVVQAISNTPTGAVAKDRPNTPVCMQSITISGC